MPQLDPTWFASQLFWLFVCFVALYFVLSKLVLPPLMQIMADRAATIGSDVEMAQRLKTEAEDARAHYEKTMAVARSDAQAMVNNAVAEQKSAAEARNKELEKQIEQKLANASTQITAKKNALMAELSPAVKELTDMIVEKLTQSSSSEQDLKVVNIASKGGR